MRLSRIAGFPYTGLYRYFLTLCTDDRQPRFTSASVVTAVLEQFRQSASRHGFALVAYCFMPDHLHLLCDALEDQSRLLAFVRDAKQRSGYSVARLTSQHLWQESFYDRVLRDEDQTLAVVKYIVMNPVRARLAKQVGEYPFCGSDRFSVEEILGCFEVWEPTR
jgi:putative transposase